MSSVKLGDKLEDIKDVKLLRAMVADLWQLLDNIDTLDDACRDSNGTFRDLTRKVQKERHVILTSDGYELYLPTTIKLVRSKFSNLIYVVHELAACNELTAVDFADWSNILSRNNIEILEEEAARIPKELVHEFVDGEETQRQKIVKVFLVDALDKFIHSVFDGDLHGKVIRVEGE